MLKSMTGFGRGEFLDTEHRFIVEIKAVNHRYNDIVIKMPKTLGGLEDRIRRSIAGTLARGRIDVSIMSDVYVEKQRAVRVDKCLAQAYFQAMQELASACRLSVENVSVYDISRYPDVMKIEETSEDLDELWPKLSEAIDHALANLTDMRVKEGAHLEKDLLARIERIRGHAKAIATKAPDIVQDYRNKLFERIREAMAETGFSPDEGRLLQEVAIMADRTNFTEELVRLESHLDQFKQILQNEGAVGRKLDFLLQEFNREANTIGSKASDLTVNNEVIELKSEIEKIREQIQNIE